MITRYPALLLPLLVLAACAVHEVPMEELVVRDGITYRVDSDEPFTGRSVKYYENGRLENRTDYKNGRKEGLSEWFWENGNLGQRGRLKNGRKDGLLEMFNQNGELTRSVMYEDGVRTDRK